MQRASTRIHSVGESQIKYMNFVTSCSQRVLNVGRHTHFPSILFSLPENSSHASHRIRHHTPSTIHSVIHSYVSFIRITSSRRKLFTLRCTALRCGGTAQPKASRKEDISCHMFGRRAGVPCAVCTYNRFMCCVLSCHLINHFTSLRTRFVPLPEPRLKQTHVLHYDI